jgi:metal-sulfur cluster biosynthetic enzyme
MMNQEPGTNRPPWEIETTHPEMVDPLKQSLSEVVDPEIGLNIVQLGLIRNVTVDDGHVTLHMILTTPFCPYGPALLESTRQKGEEGTKLPVFIDLGMEMWDFSMMEEGLGADWGLY